MIVLRLVRRPDGVAAGTASLALPETGATIGRAPDCDLVLDDPLRLVSRRHAWLVPHDFRSATLRCVSTSANLLVNGEALEPGAECLVQVGDRLRIGGFEIEIDVQAAEVPIAPPPPPEVMPVLVEVEVEVEVAMPAAPAVAAAEPPQRRRLDRFFQLDTVADPLGPGSPLPATQDKLLARAPRAASAPMPLPSPSPEPTPVLAPQRTAEPVPPAQAPPEPAARSVAAPSAADAEALRAAFLRGAGLDPALPLGVDPAWMEHLGRLLRTNIEGTVDQLRSRAVAKRNIRAEGTQIAQRENNPLKFTPDAAEALRLLLSLESRPGFLSPVDALRDAHEDLQVHQLAMIAGMRAAVADLIARLGPEALIADEGPARGLARFSALLRDAALWQRHVHGHARLIENLDDTFEAIFGREFLRAYEAQARRRPGGG